jgi:hypothetical protein
MEKFGEEQPLGKGLLLPETFFSLIYVLKLCHKIFAVVHWERGDACTADGHRRARHRD